MKILCIYHHNCADGFAAAWVVRKYLGSDDVEFHPGRYGDAPPDVTGRKVIMVDFSYKRDVLEQMAAQAESITILDHHKSAEQELAEPLPDNVRAVFDMNHSGAMITWKYFYNEDPPKLLQHIEDRDLWRFQLDGTREIQAALFSYPYDFDLWDKLMAADVDELYCDGVAITRKHMKDIHELIAAAGSRATIAGHNVPVLNAPYFYSSEAGHIMAQGEPFAACYYDTATHRVFSLRSANDGLDVAEIAAQFGGGGHKHAAGFRIAIGDGYAWPE
ncbi:hypothetical protein MBH78_18890 [Oceanimonas sp. NS1]|nr:hypothetical protein [Oceanimonas sp. NS1]